MALLRSSGSGTRRPAPGGPIPRNIPKPGSPGVRKDRNNNAPGRTTGSGPSVTPPGHKK